MPNHGPDVAIRIKLNYMTHVPWFPKRNPGHLGRVALSEVLEPYRWCD
jgi:hypothetical protein